MEHTNQKINKSALIQTIFLILLTIAIGSLIVAVIVIVKNIEEIKTDPFEFGISKTGVNSCSCYHEDGYYINYPGGKTNKGFNINEVDKNYTR